MTLVAWPVPDVPEIHPGDDLAELLLARTELDDNDVVVVTSKVVSKAAGLATTRARNEVLAEQTARVVARAGDTVIVRTHAGLILAAAGIDASNTTAGTLLPLPSDPDHEARTIRTRLRDLSGRRVAVIVSDTVGRAWRVGQTDIAIGCAGLCPLDSFEGRHDAYGNQLHVTAPAVVDQLAGTAELVSGKLGGNPFVIIRGTTPEWHTEEDGPGAAALIRPEESDLFGLGAKDAVLAAIAGRSEGFPGTGEEAAVETLRAIAGEAGVVTTSARHGHRVEIRDSDPIEAGRAAERARIGATALQLVVDITFA